MSGGSGRPLALTPMARVLVIDDKQSLRDFVREALERAGHEVWLAADGRDGLR